MGPPKNTSRKRIRPKKKTLSVDPQHLREEADQMWEGVKRAAKASYTMGGRGAGVREGGLIWVEGKDGGGGSNLEGDIVFHLQGELGVGLTFLPDYQLEGEMSLEVGVQAYTDDNYLLKEGAVKAEMLCPERHGLALSPHTGLLSFYAKVETTYHSAYSDPLENLACGSANLLMKTGTLETCCGGPTPHSPWPTDPTENPAEKFRVYRCPIPRYPFRLLAPWHRARVGGTLGRSLDYPRAGFLPPETDFRVLLRRETRVPDIMMLHPARQAASHACSSQTQTEDVTRAWRQFSLTDPTSKQKRYYELTYVKPRLRKLSLVVKRVHFPSPVPAPWPAQTHSVYRSLTLEMSKATSQVYPIAWDLAQPPATLFIMFLRQEEVMSGGGGIGDTEAKLNKLLSTCPDLFYRPLKLEELKLMDNRGVTGERSVESLCLYRMGRAVPDPSLRQYVEHLR